MTPCSIGVKLSHGLVLTSWRAHPNCSLVLNCASSSRRFLRQKLQDGHRNSSLELVKGPLCNIHRNGWRIIWDMQPERRVLPLESRSYNKSYPNPKAYCFSEIDDPKPFLVVWIPTWPPLIMLAYHSPWTKCTPWFASIIEPYHGDSTTFYNFTLLVFVYRLFRVSTLHGVGPLSSLVVMISTVRSYIPPALMSQRRSSSNAPMFDSAWKFLLDGGCRP
jgi:hypothetical protein